MKSTEQLNSERFKLLEVLYKYSDASEINILDIDKLGEALGFEHLTMLNTAQYLIVKGLAKLPTVDTISITQYGVEQYKEAMADQRKPTQYFPPVVQINTINVQNMQNSRIQQSITYSSQIIANSQVLDELKKFVKEFNSSVVELIEKDREHKSDLDDLLAEVEAIKVQLYSSKPKTSIIASCLGNIKSIVAIGHFFALSQQYLPFIMRLIDKIV